jgi:hypothetical protein
MSKTDSVGQEELVGEALQGAAELVGTVGDTLLREDNYIYIDGFHVWIILEL